MSSIPTNNIFYQSSPIGPVNSAPQQFDAFDKEVATAAKAALSLLQAGNGSHPETNHNDALEDRDRDLNGIPFISQPPSVKKEYRQAKLKMLQERREISNLRSLACEGNLDAQQTLIAKGLRWDEGRVLFPQQT